MTKFLRVHTKPVGTEVPVEIEVGEQFLVHEETDRSYHVIINHLPMSLTKEPDEDGDSYATWFVLVEEE